MRKALIAVLMAATVATPVAAQERQGGRDGFVQRVQRTVSEGRSPAREARQQQRVERQQVRQERQVQQAPRAERQVQRAERQFERAERQANRPDRSPVQVRTPAASWPGQQERANRVVNRSIQNDRRDDRRDARYERRDDRRNARFERRDDRRDARYERRDDRRDWNRSWRNDNRYDWQRYRYSNRNLFSLGRYYAPYNNYRYSRFSIGLTIGRPFYSDRYWLSDPWQYRLPPAYAGTRWVRYYDDVILVDTYSGEVLDVIYDFFW